MLGPDQPVILHLLDIPPAAQSLEGVKMELIDAALPLLAGELSIQAFTCSQCPHSISPRDFIAWENGLSYT